MLGRGVNGLIAALVLLVLASCARPSSYEDFVRVGSKGEDGLYHFTLDLSDSLARYDLSFYSRIDCGNVKMSTLRDFPMEITWISPEGQKYKEKVYFPIHQSSEGSDFYSHHYRLPYRTGLAPKVAGEWELTVQIDADDHIPGFRGIGVICERID